MNRLLAMVCSLMMVVSIVWGESPSSWTVEDLVRQTFANHPELRYYEEEVAAQKGLRTQAGLWKNPEVSGEYGSRRIMDEAGNLQGDGVTQSVSVSQTFEFPGKGTLRKSIANKNIEIAEIGLRQFRQTLEGRVRILAVEYLTATHCARSAAEIEERCAALIKLLRERPHAGTQQLLELRVIEGSLIELQQTSKELFQSSEEARIELNTLLGFPASQPLKIEADLTVPALKGSDVNTYILSGLSHNLPLRMRALELEKAKREVTAARLDVAPDFSVGPFFSQDRTGSKEENFGGTLSMTLPLWDWNQGNIATAQARRAQADALLQDARRKVEAEIARRHRSFSLNRSQLDKIPESVLLNLRDASDLADRQYRTGAIGVQLFLEVQREFLNAHQIRNKVVAETWKDQLDLELLTGGTLSSESRATGEGKK